MSCYPSSRFGFLGALVLLASVGTASGLEQPRFMDPLASPAAVIGGTSRPDRQPILAVTRAGARIVGVGLRGLIITSGDNGNSWRQASSPVQSDLVGVTFVSPTVGWAVGHEGVILRTQDGGGTWAKQLDGNEARSSLVSHYETRIAAGEQGLAPYLAQVKLNLGNGPSLPYLDVLFENERSGWAVGAFGMIVRTEDAGRTWIPWLDHIDNEKFLNLNAMARIGDDFVIAGEAGTVFVLDRKAARFRVRQTGYAGSFFGIVGAGSTAIAFGMRGTVYRSDDGAQTWQRISTGVVPNLTGGFMGIDNRTVVLVTDGGLAIRSSDAGKTFAAMATDTPMLYTGVAMAANGALVFSGFQGIGRATGVTLAGITREN
jgi:photosystem II stability/assembly factor-like uncharacterized protein